LQPPLPTHEIEFDFPLRVLAPAHGDWALQADGIDVVDNFTMMSTVSHTWIQHLNLFDRNHLDGTHRGSSRSRRHGKRNALTERVERFQRIEPVRIERY